MAKLTQCRKMELSKTNFDIDLDLYDKLIPWLNRVPSALHLSCTPSWMRGGAPRPGALLSAPSALHPSCVPSWLTGQVEQSHFNDESHSLKEESVCETTNKRTYDFKFTKKNNIILIQDIQPPPTDLEIQQGYCQRPFCQTGQNRYICTICGKHFSYIGNFRIHQKNHTGIGLNCCQFCQKTFASRRLEGMAIFNLTF